MNRSDPYDARWSAIGAPLAAQAVPAAHEGERQHSVFKLAVLRRVLNELFHVDAALTVVGVLMFATLIAALVGLIVDPRVITGAPAWLKPAKFAISTSIYTFTLVWLLRFVRGHRRLVRLVGAVAAGGMTLEVAIIVLQVVRGTTSHFNFATPLDAALFSIMGNLVVLVWLATLLAAVLLIRQKLVDRAFGWSLRLGLVVALVGMAVAFFMTVPTPGQKSAVAAGAPRTISGAHSVGVPDGGSGLPLVGWSTEGGDLRAPHFVGLHAMQVLPFVGWWLSRRRRLDDVRRTMLVATAGVGYLGLVVLLTWQALRGQSIIAPDALTLTALGGLLGIMLMLAVRALTPPIPALSVRWLIRRHPVAAFLVMVYGISWPIYIPSFLSTNGIGLLPFELSVLPFNLLATVFGITLSAYIVTRVTQGADGVLELKHRYTHWRVGIGWYLLAVFALPVLAVLVAGIWPGMMPVTAVADRWPLLFTAFLPQALLIALLISVWEEGGWTGFLLPRLQERWGPLTSSVLVAAGQGLFHVPLVLIVGGVSDSRIAPDRYWFYLVALFVFTIPVRILITWLWNSTRGSVIVVALFHGAFNATTGKEFIPQLVPGDGSWLYAVFAALAVLVIAATKGCLAATKTKRPPSS
jgi:membrane protease YdiL (CAAX protease family)